MNRIALGLLLVACTSKPRKVTDDFGAWMPKDADKPWQGAWVMRLADDDPLVAVEITGDRAKLFDGRSEQQLGFAIIEPCAVAFTGGPKPIELQFLIRDGAVVSGRGAVAYRKGQHAVVCGDGRDPGAPEEGVYIVDNNRCVTWKRDAKGGWGYRDGVCVWANARGDDLLEAGTEHYYSSLVIHGDTAEEREFTRTAKEHVRADNYEAAKALVTAKLPEVGRLELAQEAGGVIGDTTTIAGVQATYINNKGPLLDVDLELTGKLAETSTLTVQGRVWTIALVDDPAHPKAHSLRCETAADVRQLTPGDLVVVKGSIDTRHEFAGIRGCTITKAP